MSRIDDRILESVVYLYPSEEAAKAGEAKGGTGFLVGVPAESRTGWWVYAVTNSHVVREGRSPVVRLNGRNDGDTVVLVLSDAEWTHHPDGDDVAVAGPMLLDRDLIRYQCLPISMFITRETIQVQEIGPGDETFMVGRFAPHEGTEMNLPTVRFGNISMMNHEPIRHERGTKQESFLVETRSLGGYSGSPVFVRIPSYSIRPSDRLTPKPQTLDAMKIAFHGESGPWLLGVDYGHIPIVERVLEADKQTPAPQGWTVPSNSGHMAVVPAWRIRELLYDADLTEKRRTQEAALAQPAEPGIDHTDASPSQERRFARPPEEPMV